MFNLDTVKAKDGTGGDGKGLEGHHLEGSFVGDDGSGVQVVSSADLFSEAELEEMAKFSFSPDGGGPSTGGGDTVTNGTSGVASPLTRLLLHLVPQLLPPPLPRHLAVGCGFECHIPSAWAAGRGAAVHLGPLQLAILQTFSFAYGFIVGEC
jgi:hypothetical protein